jgi:PXA domain/Sorting nexin C terminal
MLPEELVFPNACRQTFTAFLLSMANHLSRKRPADVFLEFLTHSSSILVVFLNELSIAINSSPNTSTREAVHVYLESRPDSNLAYVVNTDHQLKKLDLVAEDILETFLEHKSYNCEAVRIFLREVLAKLILDVTIQMCSRAEFINEWIVYLLEDPPSDMSKNSDIGTLDKISDGSKKTSQDRQELVSPEESAEQRRHKRVVSKAQEAMDEAMKEAARLTQMIAEEDARRAKDQPSIPSTQDSVKSESVTAMSSSLATLADDVSESTNQGIHTPTSSQSDQQKQEDSPSLPPTLPPRLDPLSQKSENEVPEEKQKAAAFTTFDQLVPQEKPTALLEEQERQKREPLPLTLQNASIVIMDDSDPSDRTSMRTKPTTEYLIQVEPTTSHYPGWMIVRRLADFDSLHQVLVRIARVTDAKKFAEAHPTLPNWKGTTKVRFREDIERYLIDAVQHRSLADCEGMKRFLEKDLAMSKAPSRPGGFPSFNAIENVGKGVIDVLAQAPKGVAGGSKAIMGGVSGVLSNTRTPKKAPVSSSPALGRSSTSLSSSVSRQDVTLGAITSASQSQDSLKSSPTTIVDTQPAPVPQMERRRSKVTEKETSPKVKSTPSWASEPTPVLGGDQILSLPPPPSAIPDDYELTHRSRDTPSARQSFDMAPTARTSTSTASSSALDLHKPSPIPEEPTPTPSTKPPKPKSPQPPAAATLTDQETQIAIELSLAVITELYKLSSAWSVRLAFLNAAKTILLRPGNAQLDSLRQLMQDTLLDTHTSDNGIATLLLKTRYNTLPTDAERAEWPAERSAEEREALRRRARALLVERGMPGALNSVMGAAASAEALGRVFDAVQVPAVARGLVFGVMLQALRAVTQ